MVTSYDLHGVYSEDDWDVIGNAIFGQDVPEDDYSEDSYP